MTPIARRIFLAAVAVASIPRVALAMDALPDARFVGFAETVNDFENQSGQLALTKSSNEPSAPMPRARLPSIRQLAQSLSRNRTEAGVSMAPDEQVRAMADEAMARLNSLQGAEFDAAFADAQLRLQAVVVAQYGAYSQNGKSGPLRRHPQEALPKEEAFLEAAKQLVGSR